MPRMYRTMLREGTVPKVGDGRDMLGARPDVDVRIEKQHAMPGKGMSVTRDWRTLPHFLIPARLKHLIPKAHGSESLGVWQAGEGAFVETDLTTELRLVVNGPTHGQLEPRHPMPIPDYQNALAQTQSWWRAIDEDPEHPTALAMETP